MEIYVVPCVFPHTHGESILHCLDTKISAMLSDSLTETYSTEEGQTRVICIKTAQVNMVCQT
ncbi:hypothetical protein U0070_011865, partial [Myodes glareolus]